VEVAVFLGAFELLVLFLVPVVIADRGAPPGHLRTGSVGPGERLPVVRALAADLGRPRTPSSAPTARW
jgi:hypothetical protein